MGYSVSDIISRACVGNATDRIARVVSGGRCCTGGGWSYFGRVEPVVHDKPSALGGDAGKRKFLTRYRLHTRRSAQKPNAYAVCGKYGYSEGLRSTQG